jgi:hypothetical protein
MVNFLTINPNLTDNFIIQMKQNLAVQYSTITSEKCCFVTTDIKHSNTNSRAIEKIVKKKRKNKRFFPEEKRNTN